MLYEFTHAWMFLKFSYAIALKKCMHAWMLYEFTHAWMFLKFAF